MSEITPVFSAKVMKSAGHEQAEAGMLPADEGLTADELAVVQVDLGLVFEAKLIGGDCLAEIVFELHAEHGLFLGGGIEGLGEIAAVDLGLVHGEVGFLEEAFGVAAVGGGQDDAYADAGMEELSAAVDGGGERVVDTLCDGLRLGTVLDRRRAG